MSERHTIDIPNGAIIVDGRTWPLSDIDWGVRGMPRVTATDDGMITLVADPLGRPFHSITRGWPDGSTSTLRMDAFPVLLHPDGTLWFLDDGVDGEAGDDRYVAVDLFPAPSA